MLQKAEDVICGALTRMGNACKKPPLVGKKRCRLHGGLSPSGKAHWNYKHGKCTQEYRKELVDFRAEINSLKQLAVMLRMIKAEK